MCRGRTVIAVNHTATRTSKASQRGGGSFMRVRIEQLPSACRGFDLILESYPYPSGQHYAPPVRARPPFPARSLRPLDSLHGGGSLRDPAQGRC